MVGTQKIGSGHGRIEIEQNGNRFLEALLVRAVLFAHEGDACRRELVKQSNLPSKAKVSTGRITPNPCSPFLFNEYDFVGRLMPANCRVLPDVAAYSEQ